MLNELIESVSAKTGLSQDQAQAAVEAVIGLLKQRLPAPLADARDHSEYGWRKRGGRRSFRRRRGPRGCGHSLGSVISYDVLNGLLLEEAASDRFLNIADRTRMFLTLGSPLDKTAFLFRTQADMQSSVREVAAAAVQPMIQDYSHRAIEWVNLYSKSDIISGALDYYDPPNEGNVHDKKRFRVLGAPKADPRAVRNLLDPAARTPLAAHVEYWQGNLLAKELVRGITT